MCVFAFDPMQNEVYTMIIHQIHQQQAQPSPFAAAAGNTTITHINGYSSTITNSTMTTNSQSNQQQQQQQQYAASAPGSFAYNGYLHPTSYERQDDNIINSSNNRHF
jgi:hypothetical protein